MFAKFAENDHKKVTPSRLGVRPSTLVASVRRKPGLLVVSFVRIFSELKSLSQTDQPNTREYVLSAFAAVPFARPFAVSLSLCQASSFGQVNLFGVVALGLRAFNIRVDKLWLRQQ